MSHSLHARAAHLRHANRAGGFGNGLGIFPTPGGGKGDDDDDDVNGDDGNGDDGNGGGDGGIFGGGGIFGSGGIFGGGGDPTTSSAPPSSIPPTPSVSLTPPSSVVSSLSPSTTSSTPSTTSSTPSTTKTPPAPSVPTTTYTGAALHQTMNLTVTHYTAETAAVAAPAVSSSAPATTNALVAPVVGGVAGGVLGLAGIIFLITFFLRRRRPQEDAIDFDPGAFRRSAMPISDPPTHQDIISRGYNPSAPPAMVQRAPMYPNPATYSNYDYSTDTNSPTSGNPLVFEAPFSPITPNVSSPVAAYDRPWGAPAPVLTRSGSGSSAHQEASQHPAPPHRQNSLRAPESEYVDLERGTSVTPFQAAQYVEISKHLNTDVPKGLDTPTVNTIVAEKMDADLPPLPKEDNPFDDAVAPEVPDLPMVQELSFPAPPSPVHTTSFSRHSPRIASPPPMLPEIVLGQARVSVASAYLSPAPGASEFPDAHGHGQTLVIKGAGPFAESPMGSRFPVTPSPLASSFGVVTPPPAKSSFSAPAPVAPEPAAKNRASVYTVYDPEDAYGGI